MRKRRGVGRPVKRAAECRNIVHRVCLNVIERDGLVTLAERQGVAMAVIMRGLLLDKLRDAGLKDGGR